MGGRRADRARGCGCSPARVVAVDAMLGGADFIEVFRLLRATTASPAGAFNDRARVFRSGGFAKDAIYLRGLPGGPRPGRRGRSLDPFWLGKIAAEHPAIEELLQRGLVQRRRCSSPSSSTGQDAGASPSCAPASASTFRRVMVGVTSMLIAFFVNDLEREYPAIRPPCSPTEAAMRGHRVCYVTPSDFILGADDTLWVHARCLPKRKYKDRAEFFRR